MPSDTKVVCTFAKQTLHLCQQHDVRMILDQIPLETQHDPVHKTTCICSNAIIYMHAARH